MHDYKIAFVSVHLFKNNVQHTKVRENLSTIRVLIFEKIYIVKAKVEHIAYMLGHHKQYAH